MGRYSPSLRLAERGDKIKCKTTSITNSSVRVVAANTRRHEKLRISPKLQRPKMDLRVCFMSKPFFTAIGNIALACYMLRILQHPLVNFTFYKKNYHRKMFQHNLIHTTTIQSMINVQLIQQRLAIRIDKSRQFQ